MVNASRIAHPKNSSVKYLSKNIRFLKENPSSSISDNSTEQKQLVADNPQESPSEREATIQEPSIIKFSRKIGNYGGGIVGSILGGKVGFALKGASLGSEYGTKIAEYGAKKLIQHMPILGSFKKGGKVKKTGAYILHKGEKVVPTKRK